jgi:hypothetical protein
MIYDAENLQTIADLASMLEQMQASLSYSSVPSTATSRRPLRALPRCY